MKLWIRSQFSALLLLWSISAVAIENMTFTGTLVAPPPCEVNNGSTIDVPFNEIGIDSVDGINHRRDVPYTLSCNADPKWSMTLTLSGPVSSFDTATLQTNVDALGIKVYINGLPFELDKPFPVDIAALPRIEAVPVKSPGSTLSEQVFEVSATLQAEYQ
ncbi:fimbrial protein [Klebsiella aerogenes]|uniref:fimbrial protein n=1 Tax=Klebsiella aerogenes TaxID=548 RepID=UPI001CC4E754|nr:fimbrial protein [Klebsiella aerogenes]UNX72890.1 fimbrial protein [Klebsiella aerogenes]